jgi:hypothetical protein
MPGHRWRQAMAKWPLRGSQLRWTRRPLRVLGLWVCNCSRINNMPNNNLDSQDLPNYVSSITRSSLREDPTNNLAEACKSGYHLSPWVAEARSGVWSPSWFRLCQRPFERPFCAVVRVEELPNIVVSSRLPLHIRQNNHFLFTGTKPYIMLIMEAPSDICRILKSEHNSACGTPPPTPPPQ